MTTPGSSRARAAQAMPALQVRGDIQGLRAIAVLLVALAHAGVPGLTGGYIGVDVFFVLSGYLITSILLHEATTTGRLSLVSFYAKRARRILPAATAVLIAVAVFATGFLPYTRTDQILSELVWAALFGANILFGRQSTDYFATDLPASPYQHYWSLAVEEQFYVVWPVLLVVVLVVGTASRRGGGSRAAAVLARLPLLTVIAAIAVAASLAWSVLSTASTPSSAYFSTPARVWELGAGVLLALAGRTLPVLSAWARQLLAGAGLLMVAIPAVTFTDATPVPGYHMLVPVLGTVALLAAGAGVADSRSGSVVGRVLELAPLRWIGDLSYGFYLWHWPFLILPEAYLGRSLDLAPRLLLLLGALATAWVSLHLLENPVRRTRPLVSRPRVALLLWPAALLSVLTVNTAAAAYVENTQRDAGLTAADVDLSELPRTERAPRTGDPVEDAVAEALDRAALEAPLPFPLDQDLTALGEDSWRAADACAVTAFDDSRGEVCRGGDTGADRSLVVFGDSHLGMWLPALEEIARRDGWTLYPFVKTGCSPYDVVVLDAEKLAEHTACSSWRSWALDEIEQIRPHAVIVTSSSNTTTLDPDGTTLLEGDDGLAAWRDGVRRLTTRLLDTTGVVRFLSDTPRLPLLPGDCLSERDASSGDCTFPLSGVVSDANAQVRSALRGTPARYVHLMRLFCAERRCPMVVGNTVVYLDKQHVSRTYVLAAENYLRRHLRLPE